MQIIEVDIGPPWPTYNTFDEAIAGAEAQPEQAKAKQDSVELAGTVLESGQFGSSSCVLRFSNGKHLLIQARKFRVDWTISDGEEPTIQPVPRRILQHSGSDQDWEWEFDPNEMISTIAGSELVMLRVTGPNLLVYTRGNEIFWLSAYQDRKAQSDLLHAFFDT